MSFFKSIFRKKESKPSVVKSKKQTDAVLTIKNIERLIDTAVKIEFEVPAELEEEFKFIPGQYLNLTLNINGKEEVRSYSICSGLNEALAIGVKKVENGLVSAFLNETLKVGDEVRVSFPIGNFTLSEKAGNYVAIAGGSGITPILSISKSIHASDHQKLSLIYANRDEQSIMFENDISAFSPDKVSVTHVFSEQEKEGYLFGMMTEEMITKIIKNDLSLLKSNGFYICGPEKMIINAQNVLKTFGVPDEKIFFELFTTPVEMEDKKEDVASEKFEGIANVTVILDGEEENFELERKGDTILEEAESHGMDAPYSCRGGICSTCKAKVLEGTAIMDKNFTLTDEEVAEGYILTCQAHPNSAKVVVSFDE